VGVSRKLLRKIQLGIERNTLFPIDIFEYGSPRDLMIVCRKCSANVDTDFLFMEDWDALRF